MCFLGAQPLFSEQQFPASQLITSFTQKHTPHTKQRFTAAHTEHSVAGTALSLPKVFTSTKSLLKMCITNREELSTNLPLVGAS